MALALTFAVGGWFLYRAAPVEFTLRFQVSPSFHTGDRPIRREALVDLDLKVLRRTDSGKLEQVATASRSLGAGLVSPLSPPLHMTLPRGVYQLSVVLRTADDRQVTLMRSLQVSKEDEQRIDL